MPNHKDIFTNKVDFAHEEFSTELYKPEGKPRPRERASEASQLDSVRKHGTSKEIKGQSHNKIKNND